LLLLGLTGPTVAHCSAGIGRTGTFIAIDIAVQKLHLGQHCNIPKIVQSMRAHRRGMVQTKEQYAFVYRAIHDWLRNHLSHPPPSAASYLPQSTPSASAQSLPLASPTSSASSVVAATAPPTDQLQQQQQQQQQHGHHQHRQLASSSSSIMSSATASVQPTFAINLPSSAAALLNSPLANPRTSTATPTTLTSPRLEQFTSSLSACQASSFGSSAASIITS
jgi:hypothetical protein